MKPIDTVKLVFGALAAILIGWGIRTDQNSYRWAGIVCLAIAVLLRFIRPRRSLN